MDEIVRLTTLTASELPVDLAKIATVREIKKIEFRPLLVDGGLAPVSKGFHVYVRCEPGESERLTRWFAEDGTGKSLPKATAKQMRFTIAHEIAHTFFYDITAAPPLPTMSPKHGMQVNALEHTCNDLASAMLLPEIFVLREFADPFHMLDPDRLSRFCEKALVSRPTLVTRLDHLRSEVMPVGIIASVRRHDGKWILAAITRHYALRDICLEAQIGRPVDTLIKLDANELLDGQLQEVELIICGRRLICSVESLEMRSNKNSCLITLCWSWNL